MGIFPRDPLLVFGNDIVDLFEERDRSATFLERYSRKICTVRESEFLKDEEDFEAALWKLWALKESAFKAIHRRDLSRSFRYRELEVQSGFSSVLDHGSGLRLNAKAIFRATYVIGIAWVNQNSPHSELSEEPFLVSWIDRVDRNANLSVEVRRQAERILRELQVEAPSEPVRRPSGPDGSLLPPVLDLPCGEIPVSLSHHGCLVMTTLQLDPALERDLLGHSSRRIEQDGRRLFFLPE